MNEARQDRQRKARNTTLPKREKPSRIGKRVRVIALRDHFTGGKRALAWLTGWGFLRNTSDYGLYRPDCPWYNPCDLIVSRPDTAEGTRLTGKSEK